MNPALAQMLQEITDSSAKMVADTIASGQLKLIGGFKTEQEALASLPPMSVMEVRQNIAGLWSVA